MPTYAADTSVGVERSKAEIERTLSRYGADEFGYVSRRDSATIGFTINRRQVRMHLPLPDRNAREFTHHSRGERTPQAAQQAWEQACRQRWRALALVVKAKLEAVEAGISTFEREFLADIVLPDGRTVGEFTVPQIAIAYQTAEMPPLLAAYAPNMARPQLE